MFCTASLQSGSGRWGNNPLKYGSSVSNVPIKDIYLSIFQLFVYLFIQSFNYALKIIFCSEMPSIPDEVVGIFHLPNPSGRTMALRFGSAANKQEYQGYLFGGGGGECGRCVGLTNSPPSCARFSRNSGNLYLLEL